MPAIPRSRRIYIVTSALNNIKLPILYGIRASGSKNLINLSRFSLLLSSLFDFSISPMAPPANHDTVITIDNVNLLNVNMSNVTKLTASNFLMWSHQIQALLNGYGLAGYITGATVIPPATITTAENITVNPAYTAHQRQDQLIYSALLGAISATIQPILATTSTSAEIWEKLSATYAKPTRGHIQQLRQQVKQWKKGTKSIDEYLQGFITRFDQLALLGKPLDLEDQLEFIVEGLPDE